MKNLEDRIISASIITLLAGLALFVIAVTFGLFAHGYVLLKNGGEKTTIDARVQLGPKR